MHDTLIGQLVKISCYSKCRLVQGRWVRPFFWSANHLLIIAFVAFTTCTPAGINFSILTTWHALNCGWEVENWIKRVQFLILTIVTPLNVICYKITEHQDVLIKKVFKILISILTWTNEWNMQMKLFPLQIIRNSNTIELIPFFSIF